MAWYNQGWQDSVRLQALERLDLVDALAFQDLAYSQIQEMFGALMGLGSGAVTSVSTTGSDTGAGVNSQFFSDVGACQFYYSFPARRSDGTLIGGGVTKGFFVTHDPQDSGQQPESRLDVTALVGTAQAAWDSTTQAWSSGDPWTTPSIFPWLWARPVLVAGDQDSRRDWDTTNQIEKSVSINTRQRTRVSFRLSSSDPNSQISNDASGVPLEQPWVKIGRVLSWTNGTEYDVLGGPETPVIHPLSAWDGTTNGGWIVDSAPAPSVSEFTGDPGESTYQGTAENAGANDPGPNTGAEEQFGRPPVLGHTSGFSPFLHPTVQASTPGELTGHELEANYGYVVAKRPRHAGLISHNQIVRDRLKRHMFGAERAEVNYWDSSPWYSLPTRGLHDVVANETRLDSAELAISNNDTDIAALNARWAIIARGCVRYTGTHLSTPSWTTKESLGVAGVYNVGPAEMLISWTGNVPAGGGNQPVVRVKLSLGAGETPRGVAVRPARNWWQGAATSAIDPDGHYGVDRFGRVFGGSDFAINYSAALFDFYYGPVPAPAGDGVTSHWYVDIMLTYADGAVSNDPFVFGSFDLVVYGGQ